MSKILKIETSKNQYDVTIIECPVPKCSHYVCKGGDNDATNIKALFRHVQSEAKRELFDREMGAGTEQTPHLDLFKVHTKGKNVVVKTQYVPVDVEIINKHKDDE